MTKAELIDRIARSRELPPDISKKLIGQILGLAFEELASYFARARVTRSQSPRFTFPHFGTFTKKRRSARRGVNPRTLEPMQIEACNTVDFKASRELREAMNPGPKAGELDAVLLVEETKAKATKAKATKAKATKSKAAKRKTTKAKATKTASRASRSARRDGAALSKSRNRAPRGDDARAAAAVGDERDGRSAEAEAVLPPSPMQRIKGSRRSRSRSGTG